MTTSLFEPVTLGPLELANRIAMAPMTRARSTQPGNVPNEMMATYYAQRAAAGLIVSEATQISPQGQGYSYTPGLHSDEQVAGWRKTTAAVHAAGGRIFAQLWHVGRMSHPVFHGGDLPVAPSAISPQAQVWVADPETGTGGMVDSPVPRALETGEIPGIVADYARAAENAIAAGFDGVEIHGANGYLIDQFLRSSSNTRDDGYGGSQENRLRFLQEVVEAVAGAVGAERTGLRLSPVITQRGMHDPQILDTVVKAGRRIDALGLAYLHLAEADWDDAPETPEDFRKALRAAYSGRIIVAGRYDLSRAEAILAAGYADIVAFGRPFIANPDLPRRLRENLPLADLDPATLFGGDETGYSTYPAFETAA
ncbi:MAG: alkene reductase [Stappia sp.]|uniref:alkene reductase n=1 Tax=Stappia sp. TaxID=1870903 RepID=UPI000C4D02CF|nr:alkene reductase [Stappia sp.]MAA99061.1 alkene reductase [Stappia sp.]MBM22129.1 alkene reductase [Stappia sp.]